MGYRRLLQNYLAHVEQLLGSSLVELTPASNLFNKRDLGELRALAAEAAREALRDELEPATATTHPPDLGALLAEAIRSCNLTVSEAATIAGVTTATINRWCYTEPNTPPESRIRPPERPLSNKEFTRVLMALLAWQREQHSANTDQNSAVRGLHLPSRASKN